MRHASATEPTRLRSRRRGLLLSAATALALAAAPAGAGAATTRVIAPQPVTPHLVNPAPVPSHADSPPSTPAPAAAPSRVEESSGSTAGAQAPGPTDSGGEPDETGVDEPGRGRDGFSIPPAPSALPDYDSPFCGLDCKGVWGRYYYRLQIELAEIAETGTALDKTAAEVAAAKWNEITDDLAPPSGEGDPEPAEPVLTEAEANAEDAVAGLEVAAGATEPRLEPRTGADPIPQPAAAAPAASAAEPPAGDQPDAVSTIVTNAMSSAASLANTLDDLLSGEADRSEAEVAQEFIAGMLDAKQGIEESNCQCSLPEGSEEAAGPAGSRSLDDLTSKLEE